MYRKIHKSAKDAGKSLKDSENTDAEEKDSEIDRNGGAPG